MRYFVTLLLLFYKLGVDEFELYIIRWSYVNFTAIYVMVATIFYDLFYEHMDVFGH